MERPSNEKKDSLRRSQHPAKIDAPRCLQTCTYTAEKLQLCADDSRGTALEVVISTTTEVQRGEPFSDCHANDERRQAFDRI